MSTIVANNVTTDLVNLGGTINATHSLIESNTDQINGTDSNNIKGVDPLLDPAGLRNNGGPTQTIALQLNSPALDTGSNPNTLTTDQRGYQREIGAIDIGAVEFGSIGTAARDTLKGGLGNNVISGGDENDLLTGGDGNDVSLVTLAETATSSDCKTRRR